MEHCFLLCNHIKLIWKSSCYDDATLAAPIPTAPLPVLYMYLVLATYLSYYVELYRQAESPPLAAYIVMAQCTPSKSEQMNYILHFYIFNAIKNPVLHGRVRMQRFELSTCDITSYLDCLFGCKFYIGLVEIFCITQQ